MGVNWCTISPTLNDQVNPAPERKINILGPGDVVEQAHPKCSERFVIKIINAVMSGESANVLAHLCQRVPLRRSREIVHRYRDVRRVSKFRSRNCRRFKGSH